jgi:hypothetical protein
MERDDYMVLLWVVELRTDRALALDGVGGYPGVAADADCFYRVRDLQGKRMLSRFDFARWQETEVCPIPRHMGLVGVSRSGRTVLLGPVEFLVGVAEYLVVDVVTSAKHSVHPGGMCYESGGKFLASMPNHCPLSPDGRAVVFSPISSVDSSQRVLLCTVPPDWP